MEAFAGINDATVRRWAARLLHRTALHRNVFCPSVTGLSSTRLCAAHARTHPPTHTHAHTKNTHTHAHTQLNAAWKKFESGIMRRLVLAEGVRADGRGLADIRPISSRAGVLPRTHGSALFTRGETQVCVWAWAWALWGRGGCLFARVCHRAELPRWPQQD
jgi:hypothetical protein